MGKTAEEYKGTLSTRQLTHIKSDMTVEKALNELAAATVFSAKEKKAEKPAKTATSKTSATKPSASGEKKPAAKKSASKQSADKKD